MAAINHALDAELLYFDLMNVVPNIRRAVRRNDFENLPEEQFLERYRMSKAVVSKIVDEIQDRLEYPTNRNRPLSPMLQVLIALRFYATGSFHLMVGDNAGISKTTVSRIVCKVSEAIASLRGRYITFPSLEERPRIIQEFYEMYHFPGVLGAIDCTHVRIGSPGGNRAEIYRNRKGYFSINVQVISDANLQIRNIVARWPGSAHDSTIFSNSHIRAGFEMGRINEGILLGDSGYPLRKYLLTPYLQPQTRAEHNYNAAHIRTRNCVERMFGVWKRRFPVLSIGLRCKRQTSLTIIVATAVLHNIAVETRDQLPPEDLTLHQYIRQRRRNRNIRIHNQVPIHINNEHTAVAYRNAITQQHFACKYFTFIYYFYYGSLYFSYHIHLCT